MPSGAVLQSAVPSRDVPSDGLRAYGLKLRGVVTATYVLDDPSHPAASGEPVAVYCDVMTYAGPSWMPRGFFPRALVSQELGTGMHRGRLWKPRAATIDISATQAQSMTSPGVNPANLDGDHVLLGFLNDSLSQPVVERGLPHPNADVGFDPATESQARPHLKLRAVDGDPDYQKHAGSMFGINEAGDFVISTCYAWGARSINAQGGEPGTAEDGAGNAYLGLPDGAHFMLQFIDRASLPTTIAFLASLYATKKEIWFRSQDADVSFWVSQEGTPEKTTIKVIRSGPNAECQIGDGAVHAVQAERLEALYKQLRDKLDAFDAAFTGHTHAGVMVGPGSTGVATPVMVGAPAWDPLIKSNKLTFPDG